MDGSMSPHRGRPTAPETVWAAVKADYLVGMTATDACRLHGVGLSALRARAAREGWRRADQPWTSGPGAPDPEDEGRALEASVDGDLQRIGYGDLVEVAHARMVRAVLRNDAAGCLRWGRVLDAMEDRQHDLDHWVSHEERHAALFRAAHFPDDPDSVLKP